MEGHGHCPKHSPPGSLTVGEAGFPSEEPMARPSSEELRPGDLNDPVSEPEQLLPPTLRQQQPRPLRPETLS